MDSLTFKPSFNAFSINSVTPPLRATQLSFFNLTCFHKLRASSLCLCFTAPSDPINQKPTCNIYSFSMKGLAFWQGKKWGSRLQAYSVKSVKVVNQCSGGNVENGFFGSALLSVTSSSKLGISRFAATLAANPTFISALLSWFIAQLIKMVLNFFIEKKWDLRMLFASGGMPSSHSALCTALTKSVALCHGVADSLFPFCLGFTLIVMYDAIGVRRHAGIQAEVLNVIVEYLFQGHPISQRKLEELLGHTPSQVLAGAVLGLLVACFCCQGCLVAT